VDLNGSLGDEQGLRYLPVRVTARGQLRDPQFTWRQRGASAGGIAARPAAGDHQLPPGPAGQREAALPVSEIQSFAQDLPRLGPRAGPAARRAEIDQRAG
jgi:hypothetical protein